MTTRFRGGGDPYNPVRFERGGFIYRITGRAGRAFTSLRLLNQNMGRVFSPQTDIGKRQLKQACLQIYVNNLIRLVPVRTGRLRHSIRLVPGPDAFITLGPEPLEIRRSRRTRRNYAVAGWYARFANRRSSRSGYIQRAATQSTQPMRRLIRDYERAIAAQENAQLAVNRVGRVLTGEADVVLAVAPGRELVSRVPGNIVPILRVPGRPSLTPGRFPGRLPTGFTGRG